MTIDGKPGKVKAMGLDLRRSDTSRIPMQEFPSELLLMVLTDAPEKEVLDAPEFRKDFKLRPWI